MSSGETVARSVPTPSPGSAVMSELGFCSVAPLPALTAAGGTEPSPGGDEDEEFGTAAFPEAARPPKAAVELVERLNAGPGTHGAWGAGEAVQVEVVVVETFVIVACAEFGWLCPRVDAARSAAPDWGRNETTPTSKSARASPPTAPAKKPPLLMLSS